MLLCVIALLVCAGSTHAAFLTIPNPGNAADPRIMSDRTTNYGAVSYLYSIAPYAVSNAQWETFSPGHLSKYDGGNKPVQNISWDQAAQYCNWLTSGNKFGGAYLFDQAGTFLSIDRQAALDTYGTIFVIPTEDEWHKAAFYNPQSDSFQLYATPSDTPPVAETDAMFAQDYPYGGPWSVGAGSQELNGTFNMMGNVWEWTETSIGAYRVLRGGAYDTQNVSHLSASYRHCIAVPTGEYDNVGFRVAMIIPEPATVALLAAGGLALLRKKRFA